MSLRCPHRPPCPGCPRFGEPLQAGPAYAALARFAAQHGVALQAVPAPEARGYRLRARLALRGRSSSPKLGIFQLGSHRIADIPSCLVHHPLINEVAAVLKQAVRELHVEPYAEGPHRGLLRYAQVAVERATGTAQLVLAANCETVTPLLPLFSRVQALLGTRLNGLFFSANTARTNTILGPRCEKVSGPDALHERIAGAEVFFPPDAFAQGNLALYERIVEQIGQLVPDGAELLELYAGTGAIGLSLLPRARRVRFNELAEGSLRGLRMGIDALSPGLRARALVCAGPVAEQLGLLDGAEVVIADPPRKGLDPALRVALAARPPARVLYLSCGLDSFLADTGVLLAGRLRLRALFAYELLPFTGHLETLACFEL